jgi:hypothetical protein
LNPLFRLGFGEQEARSREREEIAERERETRARERERERERERLFLSGRSLVVAEHGGVILIEGFLPGPRRQDVGFQVLGFRLSLVEVVGFAV